MWNILVVDPEPICREGLRAILEAAPDLRFADDAADAEAALRCVQSLRPDVITLEAELGGTNGGSVAEEILRRQPSARLLVLSSRLDEAHVLDALAAGVRGYAGKAQPTAELLQAIRAVASGGTYLAPSISTYVLDQYVRMRRNGHSTPLLELTARERDIFHMTVSGAPNHAISQSLGISRRTVDTHRAHIMRKLKVHTAADLVRVAARLGVLEDRSDRRSGSR